MMTDDSFSFHSAGFIKKLHAAVGDEQMVASMLEIQLNYMIEIGAVHETPPTEETPAAAYCMYDVERRFVEQLQVTESVAHTFHELFVAHMTEMKALHERSSGTLH